MLLSKADRWAYGGDNSRRHALPGAVAFATHHDQVVALVEVCNRFHLPLTCRGRGTGTTGATVPSPGGVVLSLERMADIIQMDAANRVMRVQPGATNQQVQQAAAAHGFFWPPDPTSAAYCTVGGNLAYNSAGPRAVKYGTPRENTLGLRAVAGDGRSLTTGVYTTKGVVGYDLTRLLIGSEGTLAVITEATLKLLPLAETRATLRAVYADMRAAAEAVARIMAQPAVPCALEFMDAAAIHLVRNHASLELAEEAGALLLIEVDGQRACIEAAADAVAAAARGRGLLSLDHADDTDTTARLWAIRKALSPALRNAAPKKINEDIVVPVSRMPDLIDGLQALSRRFEIQIVNFGHAGNGNIHVNLLVDPAQPAQLERAGQCLEEVFDLVLKLQGTLSGEHGVGLEKKAFIDREIEPQTLALMRSIQRQFDPNGILNPGKMLP